VFVWLNGERRELPPRAHVPDALDALGVGHEGVAVAVDGVVVPRAAWVTRALAEDAHVEVLTAVQGG